MLRSLSLALLATALLPALAAAQPEAYEARVTEAVSEFEAHRFAEARALFEDAHTLWPNARTLRGIGLAAFELSDYVAAHRALSAALEHDVRPLTDAQRASVTALLERNDRFLGRYTFTASAEGATLTVDGDAIEAGAEVLLPLGEHEVVAEVAQHHVTERTITVSGGEVEAVHLEVVALTADETRDHHAGPGAQPPGPSDEPDLGAPVALLTIGGVLALSSVVSGLTWWLSRQEAADRCAATDGPLRCRNPDELAGARDVAAGMTMAMLGASLVSLGVGVGLLVAGSGESQSASVTCGPMGAGAQCRGRF